MAKSIEKLSQKITIGWQKVSKGKQCIYPGCTNKSTTAAFHGLPLCKDHFGLTQYISYVIFETADIKE